MKRSRPPKKTFWQSLISWRVWSPQVKQGVIAGVIALSIGIAGWLAKKKSNEREVLNSVIVHGNNNSVVYDNAAHITNDAKQDEILAIVRGMQSLEQKYASFIKTNFPWGYIILTVTERREVIPLHSPMDKLIQFNWNSEYYVREGIDGTDVKLPDFIFITTNGMEIGPFIDFKFHAPFGANVDSIESSKAYGLQIMTTNGLVNMAARCISLRPVTVVMGLTWPLEIVPGNKVKMSYQ